LTDCDTLIIIENGSVQHMGTPNDLKK
jgi:hypothetical protein